MLTPTMDCSKTECRRRCPWCVDDNCALGLAILTPQAMLWGKAAGHHGLPEVEGSNFLRRVVLDLVRFVHRIV